MNFSRPQQYQLYKCNQAITTPESSFVAAHWDAVDVLSVVNENNKNIIAAEYDSTSTYAVGNYVLYSGKLYKCNTEITSAEVFDSNKWDQVSVTEELINVDNTLTIQGDAADAKAVGDVVGELNSSLSDVEVFPTVNLHYYETDEANKALNPATGETMDNAGTYVSDFINVKNYDNLYFYNVTFVYQYDASKNYLSIYSTPENFVKNAACDYIRISLVNTNYTRKIVAVTTTEGNVPYISPYAKAANKSNVRAKFADVYEGSFDVKICGKQLLDKNIIYQNYTINAYGVPSAGNNYYLSEYIPIDQTQTKITVSKGAKIAQYNENKDFVPGTYEELNSNGTNTITISQYAKYIRVVYYYTRSCMVEYGETASTYEDAKYGVLIGGQTAIEIATPGQVATAKTEAISAAEEYTDTAKAAAISTSEGYTDGKIAEKRRYVNYCTNVGTIIDKLNSTIGFTTSKYPNTAVVKLSVTEQESLIDKGLRFSIQRDDSADCVLQGIKHIDSVDLSELDQITFWVYIEGLTKNDEIGVYLYSETVDNSHKATKSVYTNDMYYGWQMVSLYKADFTTGESFAWNSVTDISFRVVAKKKSESYNNSDYLNLTFNDLRIGMQFQPKIIFRFDDALRGVYDNAYPLLKARGFGAITYSNSLFNRRADDPTEVDPTASALAGETVYYNQVYCTTTELSEMYNNRIDIGNHSRSHLVFTDANAHYDYDDTGTGEDKRTSVLYQIEKGQRDLINLGFARSARHFAVPGGNDTELCQQALIDSGTLTSTNSQHSDNTPNVNPHKIHAWGIGKATTVETIKGYIADAIAKGRTVVLMFHDIVDDYNNYTEQQYQWLTNDLEAVLDYVVAQGWSEYVVNMSEWYDGLNRRNDAPKWYHEM